MNKSNQLKIALANMLVKRLWLNGLLSEEQMNHICEKNLLKLYS